VKTGIQPHIEDQKFENRTNNTKLRNYEIETPEAAGFWELKDLPRSRFFVGLTASSRMT